MPEFKGWIIIVLLGIIVFAYMKPDMFQNTGDKLVDASKDLSSQALNYNKASATANPVCGSDNITYASMSAAIANNITNAVPGVCP